MRLPSTRHAIAFTALFSCFLAALLSAPSPASATKPPNWSVGQKLLLQTYDERAVSAFNGAAYVQNYNPQIKTEMWKVRSRVSRGGDMTYQFANGYGLCLGPKGGSRTNGTQLFASACSSSDTSQYWVALLAYTDHPTAFFFYNYKTRIFMCATKDAPGARVVQYDTNHAPRGFVDIFGRKP